MWSICFGQQLFRLIDSPLRTAIKPRTKLFSGVGMAIAAILELA